MSGRIAASIGWLPFPIAVARSDPEQTFDAANGAADHPADNPPDRARRVVSDIRAMGGAFRNALRCAASGDASVVTKAAANTL
jgi:hypothetical protein